MTHQDDATDETRPSGAMTWTFLHPKMDENHHLTYPGDPPLKPVAMTKLRDETIRLYPADWVMITQPDGTFSIARVD